MGGAIFLEIMVQHLAGTRVFGLFVGEEIIMLIQYRRTVRQADGRADRRTDISAVAILALAACYATALVKS